jgi:hypothetical protein
MGTGWAISNIDVDSRALNLANPYYLLCNQGSAMKLELGTVAIIIAVGFYYLRLVRIEHERKKRRDRIEKLIAENKKKGKKAQELEERRMLISPRKRDWAIAAAGFAMIVVGILIRNGNIPSTNYQEYWWLPVSIGILAFSFLFG